MTLPPQYMIGNPAASLPFYGLQTPATMYSAYGGLEDLAALQRNAAGLHTLVGATAAQQQQQPTVVGQQPQGNQSATSQSSSKTSAVKISTRGRLPWPHLPPFRWHRLVSSAS